MDVSFDVVDGEDTVVDRYQLVAARDNWLQVIAYDQQTEFLTGAFQLTLTNQSGQRARFTHGVFRVRVVRARP